MEEVVIEMGIEPEIKEVLDDHKRILNRHDDDITELKIKNASFEEKLNGIDSQIGDIKKTLTRMESNSSTSTNALLVSNTSILQTLNKVIESNTTKDTNNTQVTTIKNNNRKDIAIKIIYIIAIIIIGLFALKGVTVSLPVGF